MSVVPNNINGIFKNLNVGVGTRTPCLKKKMFMIYRVVNNINGIFINLNVSV